MAAAEYAEMYQRSSAVFPEEAVSARLRGRMTATYPFHQTLIDFLNNKLALAENFQSMRGVLRVLAMTVRSLWARRAPVQVIHVSDIDLQNGAIVDELLGRTASADLRQVLTADIGSADTHNLKGGLSNAQRQLRPPAAVFPPRLVGPPPPAAQPRRGAGQHSARRHGAGGIFAGAGDCKEAGRHRRCAVDPGGEEPGADRGSGRAGGNPTVR